MLTAWPPAKVKLTAEARALLARCEQCPTDGQRRGTVCRRPRGFPPRRRTVADQADQAHPVGPLGARDCQRLLDLDGRLPAVLKGEARPRDADESLGFDQVCRCKGMHANAARLDGEASAPRTSRTGALLRSDRSAAACSAALAGTGRATDATRLDDAQRAGLRRQALVWLKANLEGLKGEIEKGGENLRPVLAGILRAWQRAPDPVGVRDEAALARLPEADERAWRDFWNAVAARSR